LWYVSESVYYNLKASYKYKRVTEFIRRIKRYLEDVTIVCSFSLGFEFILGEMKTSFFTKA